MVERIGHYRIVAQLGRGGMGVVYKAHEEILDRYVAIKVLAEHLIKEDPRSKERFLREAQSAAKLAHPNIVQIYSIDREGDRLYFVMEYVAGQSIHALIQSSGRLAQDLAARIVLQTAAGLRAAHEQGVIHRDIKPANLLMDDRGLIKIADFGLALAAGGGSRLTHTGMLVGTPGYLSPEQCLGETLDHRTDIYSLGVTYFEMLTGEKPWVADSPVAMLRQVIDVEPRNVCDLNASVDQGTRQILATMLAKEPGQRFRDCGELIRTLQTHVQRTGLVTEVEEDLAGGAPVSLVVDDTAIVTPSYGIELDPDSGATPYTITSSTDLGPPPTEVGDQPGDASPPAGGDSTADGATPPSPPDAPGPPPPVEPPPAPSPPELPIASPPPSTTGQHLGTDRRRWAPLVLIGVFLAAVAIAVVVATVVGDRHPPDLQRAAEDTAATPSIVSAVALQSTPLPAALTPTAIFVPPTAVARPTSRPRPTEVGPSPVPVVSEASLNILANIAGSEVWIDGKKIGISPCEVRVEPGRLLVAVNREGCTPDERWVDLHPGESLRLHFALSCPDPTAVVRPSPKAIAAVPTPRSEPTPTRPDPQPKVQDRRVVPSGPGMVLDRASGLMWTATDNGQTIWRKQARAHCNSLLLGGHRDWRMPTVEELETICEPNSPLAYTVVDGIELSGAVLWSESKSGMVTVFQLDFGKDHHCKRVKRNTMARSQEPVDQGDRVLCVRGP